MAIAGLDRDPVASLRGRILTAAPLLATSRAIALIDSPRWPRDLDWSQREPTRRSPEADGRLLDAALRRLVKIIAADSIPAFRLSMYPTPQLGYFARCAADPACKPHLRAIATRLFGRLLDDRAPQNGSAPSGGSLFTRFMLAGFAAYRALEEAGVETFESYPALQFKLWAGGPLHSKAREPKPALDDRRAINSALRRRLGILVGAFEAATLDQADAEVLALGAAVAARRGGLVVLEEKCEGKFLVALDTAGIARLTSIGSNSFKELEAG